MSVKAAAAKSKTPLAKSLTTKTAVKKPAKQPIRSAKQGSSTSGARGMKPLAGTKAAISSTITPGELSHRLHLLLHSIHQIERYEERLCSITDAIKRTGRLNASLRHDLQTLIEELPSEEFLHDLNAVRNAVLP